MRFNSEDDERYDHVDHLSPLTNSAYWYISLIMAYMRDILANALNRPYVKADICFGEKKKLMLRHLKSNKILFSDRNRIKLKKKISISD